MVGKSVDEYIVRPEDNFYVEFGEGLLNVKGRAEAEAHGIPSILYFGKDIKTRREQARKLDTEFRYCIPLEELEVLIKAPIPGKFYEINDHTEARKTISGGLEIRVKPEFVSAGYSSVSIFSRDEYDILKKYLEGSKTE